MADAEIMYVCAAVVAAVAGLVLYYPEVLGVKRKRRRRRMWMRNTFRLLSKDIKHLNSLLWYEGGEI